MVVVTGTRPWLPGIIYKLIIMWLYKMSTVYDSHIEGKPVYKDIYEVGFLEYRSQAGIEACPTYSEFIRIEVYYTLVEARKAVNLLNGGTGI